MIYVYLLQSVADPDRCYAGQSIHTDKHKPWRLVVTVGFDDPAKATAFERYLKSGSGRAFARKALLSERRLRRCSPRPAAGGFGGIGTSSAPHPCGNTPLIHVMPNWLRRQLLHQQFANRPVAAARVELSPRPDVDPLDPRGRLARAEPFTKGARVARRVMFMTAERVPPGGKDATTIPARLAAMGTPHGAARGHGVAT